MRTLYTLLLALAALAPGARAQVTLRLQAPRQAEVGDRIRVSYVANTTDVEDIEVGDFPGFTVLYGPSTSSSSSYTIINGKTSQSSSLTFTYTLQALKAGTHHLPAATIKVGGKAYKSGGAAIEVLPASQRDDTSGQPQGSGAGGRATRRGGRDDTSPAPALGGKDLYFTVTASKQRVYEQEAVLLTYKLYTLVNIQQVAGEMPQLDGFHVQEVNSKAQMTLKYERVNGRNYGTAVWKQYVLFPQRTGKLTVPSITFDSQVEVQNTSADPFDVFFGGGSLSQIVRKSIVAPAVQIEVLPLPEPRPARFSGAVGRFTLSGTLTPEQLSANDAATLRLVVSGAGNMKLMKAPRVDFPKDFEVYDPKENDKTQSSASGAKGNMVYDYVVVPRHGGKYSVAPVEFSYFDPDARAYKTLRTDSFHLAVAKAKGGGGARYAGQEDLKVLSDDIRFIKRGSPTLLDTRDTFFGSARYWALYLAMLAAFGLTAALFARRIRESADFSRARGRKAGRAASRRLKTAARLLRAGQGGPFYDEVMRALLGYAADKLAMPMSDLTKENVAGALAARGADKALVDTYLAALGDCEYARYAPGDPAAAMDKVFATASDAINRLDAAIRKGQTQSTS